MFVFSAKQNTGRGTPGLWGVGATPSISSGGVQGLNPETPQLVGLRAGPRGWCKCRERPQGPTAGGAHGLTPGTHPRSRHPDWALHPQKPACRPTDMQPSPQTAESIHISSVLPSPALHLPLFIHFGA